MGNHRFRPSEEPSPQPRTSPTRYAIIALLAIVALVIALGAVVIPGLSNRGLRVAYLKQADSGGAYNLWIADPDSPEKARQITFTRYGVLDYDVSGDGRYIAYTERGFENPASEIILLDLRAGQIQPLTDCRALNVDCASPRFRPGDNRLIAYQRTEHNVVVDETGREGDVSYIWLIDRSNGEIATFPLINETQLAGTDPEWSADGSRLAFYDPINLGIVVYDFAAGEAGSTTPFRFIDNNFGLTGALSPDGRQLVFPQMVFDGLRNRAYLQLADLDRGFFQLLTLPDEFADDQFAAWSPDGRYVAIARQYIDERYTRGAQIYRVDMTDGSATPLIDDPEYSSTFVAWSPDGTKLAIQRFHPTGDSGNIYSEGTIEVWTYDMETGDLTKIAENARSPLWAP